MQAFARSTIRVLQNCFLDRLFRRSIPLLLVIHLGWSGLTDGWVAYIPAAVGLALVLFAWIIGTSGLPDDKPANTNGFSTWDEEPAEGRHPPASVRRLVTWFGADPERQSDWLRLLSTTLMIVGMLFAADLGLRSSTEWGGTYPPMADVGLRQGVFLTVNGLVGLIILRNWATDQRADLNPQPSRPNAVPDAVRLAVISLTFMVGMALYVTSSFDLSGWYGVGVAVALFGILAAPPWRTRIIDAIFGKPTTEAQ